MPMKPVKWGMKVWGDADSDTGYILKCDVYSERRLEGREFGLGALR